MDDDVDAAAKFFVQQFYQDIRGLLAGDVGQQDGPADRSGQPADRITGIFKVHADDMGPFTGQRPGNGGADPAGCPRYQSGLAAQGSFIRVLLGQTDRLGQMDVLGIDVGRARRQQKTQTGLQTVFRAPVHQHQLGRDALLADLPRHGAVEPFHGTGGRSRSGTFQLFGRTAQNNGAAAGADFFDIVVEKFVEPEKLSRRFYAGAVQDHGIGRTGIVGRRLRNPSKFFAIFFIGLELFCTARQKHIGSGCRQDSGQRIHHFGGIVMPDQHHCILERPFLPGCLGPVQLLRQRDRQPQFFDDLARPGIGAEFQQIISHYSLLY